MGFPGVFEKNSSSSPFLLFLLLPGPFLGGGRGLAEAGEGPDSACGINSPAPGESRPRTLPPPAGGPARGGGPAGPADLASEPPSCDPPLGPMRPWASRIGRRRRIPGPRGLKPD